MPTINQRTIRVGCAGWSIRREQAEQFPTAGSHLERYAARLPAVEINTSFYRPHRPETYARWAASVPADFQFAVKVPRAITHERRLLDPGDLLNPFLDATAELGDKLGPLLVQLPPSLVFARAIARRFFTVLRERFTGLVACEPRHPSWFEPAATALLTEERVARVAADPAVVPAAAEPGGWSGLVYYRLHGAPTMYYSSYPEEHLRTLTGWLQRYLRTTAVWCIFDNTAEGAATLNALDVLARLRHR